MGAGRVDAPWDLLDYSATYLVGRWPGNQVRFWVESRTRLWDERGGWNDEFFQCGACKSEHTFVARNLFHKENYDFTPVFGREYGAIFRRKAAASAGYKEVKRTEEMWGGVICHLRRPKSVRRLLLSEEIAAATHRGLPLIGRTTFSQGSVRVEIEFPVKTINIHVERRMFQVDTGPVAFPDLAGGCDRPVDAIGLAYVAFSAFDWAEFIIEAETPIAQGAGGEAVRVHHYSRIVEMPVTNELFAVLEPASFDTA